MRGNVNLETPVAKRGQIGNRCLRAKQDDEVRVAGKRVARMKSD